MGGDRNAFQDLDGAEALMDVFRDERRLSVAPHARSLPAVLFLLGLLRQTVVGFSSLCKRKPTKLISDSSEEQSLEIESNVEIQSSQVSETVEPTKLINREEDLSIYLTKQPPKQSPVREISFDERVDNVLKAHDLHFGWQKVVQQGILDIDEETETKVNRAISLVRRGSPLKSALFEADIDVQVASFLLAISFGDTEALSSLSKNVSRVGE